MKSSRFLECLASDYVALREAAAVADLAAPVPSCPDWSVTDLIWHVGEVYLHKVAAMREGKWPDPWPPPGLSEEEPLALLSRAYGELTGEFANRSPESAALTWYPPDQTVGFWIRRMAQETVIHRIDAQLAADVPVTAVPADLATDGIDEVLRLFLGYESSEWPEQFAALDGAHLADEDGKETIAVVAGESGAAAWTVRPSPRGVAVEDGASENARTVVTADQATVLRWLWGRAADSEVEITGDPAWAAYLRRMLTATTQ